MLVVPSRAQAITALGNRTIYRSKCFRAALRQTTSPFCKNMNNLIEITDDLFDISRRLKSVDEDYRLYYNGAKRRYEVHNRKQCGSTLAFVVPFEELDARTVEYARKTRAENIELLLAEMDKHNAEQEQQNTARAVEAAMSAIC